MGVRLYNPTTGQFTSPDPIPGGNDTAYSYPNDPVNVFDLTGEWGCGWCHRAAGVLSTVSTWAAVVPFCGPCQAVSVGAGLLSAGLYGANHEWGRARRQLQSTAVGFAFGGFKLLRHGRHFARRARHVRHWRHTRHMRHAFHRVHRFAHHGGFSGRFSHAARRAGRSRGYRAYWGLKMHGLGLFASYHAGRW